MELMDTQRRHPITGLRILSSHICGTCAHFTNRQRQHRGVKYRTITCASDPEGRNLSEDESTSWPALPACEQHTPSDRT